MDAPILGQVALSYCPIIDRQRNPLATRLTVFPLTPGAELPVAELLEAVTEVWPANGPQVCLSVRSEGLLFDLLNVRPAANVMIEVPKFLAADPFLAEPLATLAKHGNVLLLTGRPDQPLPPEVLRCFRYSIIDIADERRLDEPAPPSHIKRGLGFMQDGVRTVAQMEGAFKRNAVAVVGWPIDDMVQQSGAKYTTSKPDLAATIDLINQVDQEEPLDKIEVTLKRDPPLAYKLMRYINSPIFGLRTEVTSFTHAVMLLGYQRLKRWLALLLVTASSDPNLRPVMFAAVRRGLVMEGLAPVGAQDSARSELFICGVFSLLDRMFQEPFKDLLKKIPVPDDVFLALAEERGPLEPMVRLARCLEGGSGVEIREIVDETALQMRQVNKALLLALSGAIKLT
jgi:EAL and modified HD-GYP domain-containing signal transduction protein